MRYYNNYVNLNQVSGILYRQYAYSNYSYTAATYREGSLWAPIDAVAYLVVF